MTAHESTLRTAMLVVLLLFAIPMLMMIVMMPVMAVVGWEVHTDWHGSGSTWAWAAMMVVPVLLVFGLGYLFYRTVSADNQQKTESVLEELRIAYARGELTDEEFETRHNRLRGDT